MNLQAAGRVSRLLPSYATVAHSSALSTQGAARSKALLTSVVVGERYCSWIASIAAQSSSGSVSNRNASRHSSTCLGEVVPVMTPALYQRSLAHAMANSVGVSPHASASLRTPSSPRRRAARCSAAGSPARGSGATAACPYR